MLEADSWNGLNQHKQLLNIFINHELKHLCALNKSNQWDGKLSREAETMLHQHAIQNDISELQIALWFVKLVILFSFFFI